MHAAPLGSRQRQRLPTVRSPPYPSLVARKSGKDTPEGSPYIRLFHKRTDWQPDLLGVFAGKLNYPVYGWRDRNIIRFIMWLTKGPTDPSTVKEFTDWGKVELFADQVSALTEPV